MIMRQTGNESTDREIELLFTPETIEARLVEMSRDISRYADGESLFVVGLLAGCYMVLADLSRQLHLIGLELNIDFLALSSYEDGKTSKGSITLIQDLTHDIRGKRVLLVDDIIDTGLTLQFARDHLLQYNPDDVKIAVLLDKPSGRRISLEADYVGFQVPDVYLVGYGLDYAGKYRELPGIYKLDE